MVMALVGCASGRSPSAEAPIADAAARCADGAEPQEAGGWQRVVAQGFTFCVPAHWRPGGGRSWRGDGMTVEWLIGPPPEGRPVPDLGPGPDRPIYRTFVESIGGEQVEINTVQAPLEFRAYATWKAPGFFLQGEAPSSSGRAVLLAIYRSVRRTSP
jgi:hypothetical protein